MRSRWGGSSPTFTYTIAKQPRDVLSTADGSGEAPDLSQGVRNYSRERRDSDTAPDTVQLCFHRCAGKSGRGGPEEAVPTRLPARGPGPGVWGLGFWEGSHRSQS